MGERLQKILSKWGIASRRRAEALIIEGRVTLNGVPATLGQQADPDRDAIEVDGQPVLSGDRPRSVYLLMNKPYGVVSTCQDQFGRKTVLDVLPKSIRQCQGIHPVGRLDAASTGALLLTNDGTFTFRLTHPSHSIAKTYEVWVRGTPNQEILNQWRQGVMLDGRKTRPAQVAILKKEPHRTLLNIVLREGRNRQIRRMAEQLGHPVLRLHRTAIGPITLHSLKPGDFRELTTSEVIAL
jgi:23S rRNA pseudouridine2605 synthase